MTATEHIEHSDAVAIHTLLYCCKYYGLGIDIIKTYTYSRIGVMIDMIPYLEGQKKLSSRSSYAFKVSTIDQLEQKILEKFAFLS